MRGLGGTLAVEFEKQFGMPSFAQGFVQIEMAANAGVGASVDVVEIAHPSGDDLLKINVRTGVESQPVFSRSVAGFTSHAAVRLEVFDEEFGVDALHGSVADVTLHVLCRVALNAQSLGDAQGGSLA